MFEIFLFISHYVLGKVRTKGYTNIIKLDYLIFLLILFRNFYILVVKKFNIPVHVRQISPPLYHVN